MELRIKFSAEVIISGDSISEIRSEWETMSLFSKEAMKHYAEFDEVLLVDDEDYNDLTSEFECCNDPARQDKRT
jgi:2-hydroxy-3-keto-5-methylthiopentenyl-1-phosphate phosphatase